MIISFDVDGTLKYGPMAGPIPLSYLEPFFDAANVSIGITGNYLRFGRASRNRFDWVGGIAIGIDKRHAIFVKTAILMFAGSQARGRPKIHVGDMDIDKKSAESAGWDYWTPQRFLDEFRCASNGKTSELSDLSISKADLERTDEQKSK